MQNWDDLGEAGGLTSEELLDLLRKSLGLTCIVCDNRNVEELIPIIGQKEGHNEKYCANFDACLNRREARWSNGA